MSSPKGRFRLSNMALDFVSLVPAGDDPMAQVVIAKAAPNTNGSQEATMGDQIAKDDLAPEVVAYINGLEDEVDLLSKQVETSEGEVTELRDTLSKMAPKDEQSAEAISKALLAKADPAVRALIEKQNADLAEVRKQAEVEKDKRETAEYISKAAALPMINEGTDDLAGLLRRAAAALTPEDSESLTKVLKAANAQIAEGNLFKSLGNGGGESTISASVEAKASDIQKAEPGLTRDQAIAKAYEQNPALLAEAMTNQEG